MGDGEAIDFWNDNWLLNTPLLPLAQNPDVVQAQTKVSRFITAEKTWDETKIRRELQDQLSQDIIKKIIQTTIPSNYIKDRMYWGPSSNRWFSTKSSINLIQKEKGHSSAGTD